MTHRFITFLKMITVFRTPRQLGKTYSLVQKFLQNPNNTLFYTINNSTINHMMSMYPELRQFRQNFVTNTTQVRGRRIERVLIDEIYNKDIDMIITLVIPTGVEEIIITTSESGHVTDFQHDSVWLTDKDILLGRILYPMNKKFYIKRFKFS
jgi:predicted AAA+ superfamily ATPase